jgi:bla regulator protein blaR1
MRNPHEKAREARRKHSPKTAGFAALTALVILGTATETRPQTQTAEPPGVPQWQIDAGGKMAFEVASVKQNKCGPPPTCPIDSNIELIPGDSYAPTGGFFTATNWYLMPYIVFAYKLDANAYQYLRPQLPKWANADSFDIQARATDSNPTKDQMRLMMQSLLADRFKLVVHTETRQLPVLALVLDKPGKLGPQLRQHLDDPPCPSVASSTAQLPAIAGGYPAICGYSTVRQVSTPGHRGMGGRNVTMQVIGGSFSAIGQLGRPVLDRTGLKGNHDYIIEWTPAPNGTPTPAADALPEPSGPTFIEALKDQLGLKLVPQTGAVDVLVIDYVEEPLAN